MTIKTKIAGLDKIRKGARNHHLGLKKYVEKRLLKINQQLKYAQSQSFRFWLLRYRSKLHKILAIAN